MRKWVKILPLFIVEWLARRYCMKTKIGGYTFVEAYGGPREPLVLFEVLEGEGARCKS